MNLVVGFEKKGAQTAPKTVGEPALLPITEVLYSFLSILAVRLVLSLKIGFTFSKSRGHTRMEFQPALEVCHTHDGHVLLRGFLNRRREMPAQAEGHDRHDEDERDFFPVHADRRYPSVKYHHRRHALMR